MCVYVPVFCVCVCVCARACLYVRVRACARVRQIVLSVLSRSRTGHASYIGHVRLSVADILAFSIPADAAPPAPGSAAPKPGSRVAAARGLPLDYRVVQRAALYSGGGAGDCRVLQWDVATGNVLRSFPRGGAGDGREGHAGGVTGIVETEAYGARRLFSASLDGTVRAVASRTITICNYITSSRIQYYNYM